jgi:DNA repair photolyase
VYCFSQFQKGIGVSKENYASITASVNPEVVKSIFDMTAKSKMLTALFPFIEKRMAIQWGGLADPFDNYERQNGLGLKLLRYFHELKWPICFSTKGTWWTTDSRYAELFQTAPFWNVKFSIITLDKYKASQIERGVPTPEERLEALARVASWKQGGATLRLRPFIIGISSPTHTELIRRAGAAGAGAVSTEFFCFDRRSPLLKRYLPVLSQMCGFDLMKFYIEQSVGCGYLRLNRELKRRYVDEMEAATRSAGMRFYVSDAHFKERCDNGSCCGLPPSWNYSRGQFTEALLIAKAKGRVRFRDISCNMEHLAKLTSEPIGFNTTGSLQRSKWKGKHLLDMIRHNWNNIKGGKSPAVYFGGILVPESVDEDHNIVYRYNEGAK